MIVCGRGAGAAACQDPLKQRDWSPSAWQRWRGAAACEDPPNRTEAMGPCHQDPPSPGQRHGMARPSCGTGAPESRTGWAVGPRHAKIYPRSGTGAAKSAAYQDPSTKAAGRCTPLVRGPSQRVRHRRDLAFTGWRRPASPGLAPAPSASSSRQRDGLRRHWTGAWQPVRARLTDPGSPLRRTPQLWWVRTCRDPSLPDSVARRTWAALTSPHRFYYSIGSRYAGPATDEIPTLPRICWRT